MSLAFLLSTRATEGEAWRVRVGPSGILNAFTARRILSLVLLVLEAMTKDMVASKMSADRVGKEIRPRFRVGIEFPVEASS